jgi:hypothetical protein
LTQWPESLSIYINAEQIIWSPHVCNETLW